MPSNEYSKFVKEHYASVRHLPHKERFAAIAKKWHAAGHSAARPAHHAHRKGHVKGGGILSGLLGSFGL